MLSPRKLFLLVLIIGLASLLFWFKAKPTFGFQRDDSYWDQDAIIGRIQIYNGTLSHNVSALRIMQKAILYKLTTRQLHISNEGQDYIPPVCQSSVRLVVLVCASPADVNRRMAIRQTWGRWINLWNSTAASSATTQNAMVVFFFGEVHNPDLRVQLFSESQLHRDIIYFPHFVDSYNNLTLKTFYALSWVLVNCVNVTHVFKADLDIFLNLPKLLDTINSVIDNRRTAFIFGNVQKKAAVVRDNQTKWYVSKEDFPLDVYPDYVTGPGYLLDSAAVRRIVQYGFVVLSQDKRPFIWEDICVTGLWADTVHVTRIHTDKIWYSQYLKLAVCSLADAIVLHRVSIAQMHDIWAQLNSPSVFQCPRGDIYWNFQHTLARVYSV